MNGPEREPALPADEVHAAVRARGELGGELEREVIESFLANVGGEIDRRVDERVAGRGEAGRPKEAVAVALGSLGIAIPLTAIAGGTAGLAGILLVWIGIVVVNVGYALGRR